MKVAPSLAHSNLRKKMKVRAAALAEVPSEGLFWLPYCGIGALAEKLDYPPDRIDACDRDEAMVERFRARFPAARCTVELADRFQFDPTKPVAFADVDPYQSPWKAVKHLATNAPLASTLVLVTTEDRVARLVSGRCYDFETMRYAKTINTDQARAQDRNLPDYVLPWLEQLTGYTATLITRKAGAERMMYLAIRLDGEPRQRSVADLWRHLGEQRPEEWPLEDLRPYPGNAKRHPPEQVKVLARSIAEYGWTQPIVVDVDGVVICGHGRLAAAKELVLERVPVIVADLPEAEARAYRLLDNRLAELGAWDHEQLATELEAVEADEVLRMVSWPEDRHVPGGDTRPLAVQHAKQCPKCGHEFV